jgi:hypothetical protein
VKLPETEPMSHGEIIILAQAKINVAIEEESQYTSIL